MRITVLGRSPAWQDAGGACSSYLVQQDGCNVLLDCGNGAFAKLREVVDYVDVHAVVVSHLHADHFLDLIPFAYALTYSPRQQPVPVPPFWAGTESPAKPRLLAPAGARAAFRRVVGAWGAEELIENAFDLEEYSAAGELELGPLRVRFCEVPHFILTHAVEFENAAGARFTFGADHSPNDAVCEFGRDTDLLMLEATLPRPERTGLRGHITPGEAGEHARAAGAKRFVITHISEELLEGGWAADEAAATFGGAVEVAHEGAVYEI